MRAFPVLGFDPCPGEPAAVREIAGTLRRSADAMARAADILRGQDHQWRGEAAEAFGQRVGVCAPEQLARAEQSFLAAGSALTGWAALLEANQRQADVLEAHAANLVLRTAVLEGNERALDRQAGEASGLHLPSVAPGPDPARYAELSRQLASLRSQLDQAHAEVTQLRVAAERLRASTVEAAAGTARALLVAKQLAPLAPGFWRQALGVADAAVGAFGDVAAGYWQWQTDPMGFLKEHQEALRFISDVTGMASSVLSILALVPGCQALAVPALALGVVSTVSAYGAEVGRTGSVRQGVSRGVVFSAATTLAGAGALRTASKVTAAARGGNFTRVGVTVGGRTFGSGEHALSTLGAFRHGALPMGDSEMGWRVAHFYVGSGSLTLTGLTINAGVRPAGKPSPWGQRLDETVHGRVGTVPR